MFQSVPASQDKQTCLGVWSLLQRKGTEGWFTPPELGLFALYYLEYRKRGLKQRQWLVEMIKRRKRQSWDFDNIVNPVFYPFPGVWNSIWGLFWSSRRGLTPFMPSFKVDIVLGLPLDFVRNGVKLFDIPVPIGSL